MNKRNNNMDKIDKILYDYFDSNKKVPKIIYETIENTPYDRKEDVYFKKNNKISEYNLLYKIIASIVAIVLFATGMVYATILLSDIFNLSNIGIKNDGVVDAIENKEYLQNVDMNYIQLNENYKIKVDYLMMDDINLYLTFNLISNKSINTNYRLSLLDLNIFDNNGICLYDATEQIKENKLMSVAGWKNINTNEKSIRELLFIVSSTFENIRILNISFTKLCLYDANNPSRDCIEISCDCSFSIEISDKFIKREIIEYTSLSNTQLNYNIEKCIATDTGLYLVYSATDPSLKLELLNLNVNAYKRMLGSKENKNYMVMVYNLSKDELEDTHELEFSDSINILTLTQIN